MSELRFAEPQWIHALWVVAGLVVLLLWLERRGASDVDRLVSPTLQPRLTARPGPARRSLRVGLLGLALVCGVVALMRPQWGLRHVPAPRLGAELMICLDVSRSMLAEDAAPSRLARAKAEIADLLALLEGDHVGLIAFAGRASVLAPLTPDFGFLRLVLDDVGPHSVSLGGTRLEEPIRKSLAGFDESGVASRALLLFSDGEHHGGELDEVTREALDAGVRIIAVGLGSETGSEIWTTDPRSGARERLRDAEGAVVQSRLRGERLRDLALATGGAYVPAGTRALDLVAIHRAHIAPLTRGGLDPRGRTVRDEGYPWALLAALLALVASVAAGAGATLPRASGGAAARASLALGVLLLAPAAPRATGRVEPPADPAATSAAAPAPVGAPAVGTTAFGAPRELYSRGVALLARVDDAERDTAERLLRRARLASGDDAELRASSAYNLGWLLATRAQALETDEPERALRLHHEAADWLRDAVQQGGEAEDARHNLEVVLRRALELADRIASAGERDFETELRALSARQRDLVRESARLLARQERVTADEDLRRDFRGLEGLQRALLSDAEALARRADDEHEAIGVRVVEGVTQMTTAYDAMHVLQLRSVLRYLQRARERMGQARRQLRQRQALRAYRRASAALLEIGRALDQMRDPPALLNRLTRDALELAEATRLLEDSERDTEAPVPGPTLWVSRESLGEAQGSLADRTAELGERLRVGLESQRAPGDDPYTARVVEAVQQAQPHLQAAGEQLEVAAADIASGALARARQQQAAAIESLHRAREPFLDARGLIEALHADQSRIGRSSEGPEEIESPRDAIPLLRELQARNLGRATRLEAALEEGRAQSGEAVSDPGGEPTRRASAREGLARGVLEMERSARALVRLDGGEASAGSEVGEASARALHEIAQLRVLFLTAVDHVRELLEGQVELADRTRDLDVLGPGARGALAGRLVPAQRALADRTAEVASSLDAQARAEEDEENARELLTASEHMASARTRMASAADELAERGDSPGLARESQDRALGELREALALLVAPGEGREGAREQGDPQVGPEESASLDPEQLLQAVREREAERRRAGSRRRSSEPVERDW